MDKMFHQMVAVFCIFLGMLPLVLTLPDFNEIYHYQGYTQMPFEQALKLQSEYDSGDIAITTISDDDAVWITYDFCASETNLYSLDSNIMNWHWIRWFAIGAGGAFIFLGLLMLIAPCLWREN